ncbi:cytochrome c550 [Ureibacillus sp. MALMAid1270]|uniref:cytochrome c550 n=1 Tax=Ureibacillus sp. MALMAid1270 TaxID=3411629 RepID=UPI003BA7A640
MKNNPVIPYILIMAFGIGLIFFMSMEGVGNKEEIAHGGEHGETAEEGAGGAELVSSCIACHGGDLTGGAVGPNLVGLTDVEHIKDVIMNGQGQMPPQDKSEAEAQAIAEYITSLK